ncbi:hypothetical protein PYCC9005_004774 [Savitreella phatthalungensis]
MSLTHSHPRTYKDEHDRVYARAFDLEQYTWIQPLDCIIPCDITSYDPDKQFYFVACPNEASASRCTCNQAKHRPLTPAWHLGSVLCHIDAACRRDEQGDVTCSYGLWFGPKSKHNRSRIVRSNKVQTKRAAEIVAAYEAIQYVRNMQTRSKTTHIILCTDSQYLVDAMTFHVATFRDNDYRGRQGRRVRNGTLLRKLDELIRSLEDIGVNVDFWEIDRDLNEEADELAARALRGLGDDLMSLFQSAFMEYKNRMCCAAARHRQRNEGRHDGPCPDTYGSRR